MPLRLHLNAGTPVNVLGFRLVVIYADEDGATLLVDKQPPPREAEVVETLWGAFPLNENAVGVMP